MAKTIFFRVGTNDHITLPHFIGGLKNFLGILQDVDAALSDDPRGSVKWEVSSLQKHSRAVIGVTAFPKRVNVPDLRDAIQAQVLLNTHSLTAIGERNEFMPDAALSKMKQIARRVKAIGPSAIFVNANGDERKEEVITEQTYKHVSDLTDPRFSAYGSLVGKLDSISVHNGNEFRVWDRQTGKPVRCIFQTAIEPQVKDYLRQIVMVAGIVHSNSGGVPIKLELEELELFADKKLPSIQEMSGLVDDFTGGKTLKEYLEDMADE